MLSAQQCRSADHNELLFIIQHQTSELWMKLVRHELVAARERLRARDLQPAFKMLARVSKVMAQLVHAWDVLATMTPSEYSAMRPALGSSSGLQSWQYRLIALLLGDRNHDPLASHRSDPTVRAMIEDELRQPSIYEVALERLSDNGLLSRPATARPSPEVEAAWLKVYRHPAQHWNLYQLAEELIDLEDAVRQWRFRHVTTVERIIGFKPGTGGSDGVPYLRRQLEVVLFPELWSVRTQL